MLDSLDLNAVVTHFVFYPSRMYMDGVPPPLFLEFYCMAWNGWDGLEGQHGWTHEMIFTDCVVLAGSGKGWVWGID